jgi:hypothetical protein
MSSRKFVYLAIMLLALALVRIQLPTARAAAEPIYIVAAQTFPAVDISFANLKSAFRGQPVEMGGKRLVPVNHPLNAPLRVAFDQIVLGLDPSAVGRFWVDQRIRDEGKPPTTASTPEIAVRVAASLAGAITYASKEMLNPKLKVLTVDKKSAGQPGYAVIK